MNKIEFFWSKRIGSMGYKNNGGGILIYFVLILTDRINTSFQSHHYLKGGKYE
jgi:hypothetical protein